MQAAGIHAAIQHDLQSYVYSRIHNRTGAPKFDSCSSALPVYGSTPPLTSNLQAAGNHAALQHDLQAYLIHDASFTKAWNWRIPNELLPIQAWNWRTKN